MALHIIYGRAHSGKTTYITNMIKEKNKESQKAILVVPEQFTHIAETNILKSVGKIQDDVIEITSFKRLADRTRRAVCDYRTGIISEIGKSLVISDILEGTSLEYYKNTSSLEGFVDVCIDTISEFKKYNIAPSDLDGFLSGIDDEILKIKLQDLKVIYESYEKSLSDTYVDTDDILDILANTLKKNNLYSEHTFYFDAFSTFIPQERAIIAELIKGAKDVYITLTMDSNKSNSLFLPCITTYNQLKDICRENNLKMAEDVVLSHTYFKSDELSFIEKHLFEYPTKKYSSQYCDVSLTYSNNPYSEVENACINIVSCVRDLGYRYRDICVICSDLQGYAHIFKNVFKKFSLPFFIDDKTKILDHRVVVFVLNILDVYIDDYSYESIFNFLKSGFFNISAENISKLDNFISKTNATKNAWLSIDRWENLVREYTDDEYEIMNLNYIRENCILPLAKFHDEIKGKKSVLKCATELYNYLCSVGLDRQIEKSAEKLLDWKDTKRAREYERIWELIINALDEVVNVFGQKNVSVKVFRKYLYTAFAHERVGVIPTSVDEIMIGDIARTRTEDIKVLFILGANEGVFPIPAKSELIITDRDKVTLSSVGKELPNTSDKQAFVNQFLVYCAFTNSNEKLYVSYSASDNEYATLSPSFFVGRLKKMFHGIEKSDRLQCYDDLTLVNGEKTTFENLVTLMGRQKELSGRWGEVYGYFRENKPKEMSIAEGYFNCDKGADKILPYYMAKYFGDKKYTSVSKLQIYSNCHFSFFAQYMLGLKEKPVSNLKNVDIGNIAHDIIEKIYKDIEREGRSIKTVTKEYLDKKIEHYIGEYIYSLGFNAKELTKRQLFSVQRLKFALIYSFEVMKKQMEDSMFEPVGYEVSFSDDGEDEGIGSIKIFLENGEVLNLVGKIDRVDTFDDGEKTYLRVIDYKTGHKSFNISKVIHGIDIQLMVYLNALVKSNSKNEYGGAFFFNLSDAIISSKGDLSPDKIAEKLESATKLQGIFVEEDIIKEALEKSTVARNANKTSRENFLSMDKYLTMLIKDLWTSLEGGNIDIKPYRMGNKTPCSYCAYKGLCRFDISKPNCKFNDLISFKTEDGWQYIKEAVENENS